MGHRLGLLCAVGALFIASPAWAVTVVTSDSPGQLAAAGSTVAYTITVDNQGSDSHEYAVSVVTAGQSWTTGIDPATVGPVPAGDSVTLTLKVEVPAGATPGQTSTATVTATSVSDAAEIGSAMVITGVAVNAGVTVSPETSTEAGLPDASVVHSYAVKNTGNTADSFDLSLSGQSWTSTLSAAQVGPLGADETAMVTVTMTIPSSATGGQEDSVTLTATSASDPSTATEAKAVTQVTTVRAVSVTPAAASAAAAPGATAVYTFTVKNEGTVVDTYSLAVAGAAWGSLLSETQVGPLDPGESASASVTVTVPVDALAGDSDTSTLVVTSLVDGSISAEANLTTSASVVRGVTVTPASASGSADPASTAIYTLTIENAGNAPDTFDISITDGAVFPATAEPTSITLAALASGTVEIRVIVPADTPAGTTDTATVTVTSTSDASVTGQAVLATSANTVAAVTITPVTAGETSDPGTSVDYVLTVRNDGNAADTFAVTLDNPDFSTEVLAQVGPVAPGDTAVLTVTVDVPDDARAKKVDSARVTLTSMNVPSVNAAATVSTTVGQVFQLSIDPSTATQPAGPGVTVSFEVRITNEGNGPDTFDVEVDGAIFPVRVADDRVGPIDAGDSETVRVRVTVPDLVRSGTQDRISVVVTSRGDDTIVTEALYVVSVSRGADGYITGSGISCAVSPARAGQEPTAMLLLAALLVALAMRRPRALALSVAMVLLAPTLARAQDRDGFRIGAYRAPPSAEDGFALALPHTIGASRWSFKMTVDYAADPLVLGATEPAMTADDPLAAPVIEHRVPAHLSALVGVGDKLELFVVAPVLLYQSGADDSMTRGPEFASAESFALFDPELGASVALLPFDSVFQLGVTGALTFPIGSEEAFTGDGGFGGRGAVEMAFGNRQAAVALQVGAAYRPDNLYARHAQGSELTFAAGLHAPVGGSFFMAAELYGATSLVDREETATSERFNRFTTPVESLIGFRWLSSTGLVLGLAGGFGIGPAPGTPSVRGLATVGWASGEPATRRPGAIALRVSADEPDLESPDPDGDGKLTGDDRCPLDAEDPDGFEDEDGCPDQDNDQDGIFDIHDRCPDDKETPNNFEDLDGCPDSIVREDEDEPEDDPAEPEDESSPPAEPVAAERPELPGPVAFSDGSVAVDPASAAELEQILTILESTPQIRSLAIEGHTSTSGRRGINMRISRKRAQSVHDWLVARGIDPKRLLVIGFGPDRSRGMDEDTARRVEFRIAKWKPQR